jgi:hypothetical protein
LANGLQEKTNYEFFEIVKIARNFCCCHDADRMFLADEIFLHEKQLDEPISTIFSDF